MKRKIIEYFLILFAQLISYIYTPGKKRLFDYWKFLFKTYWLKRSFRFLGEESLIMTTNIVGHQYISIGNKCTIGERAVLAVHSVSTFPNPTLKIGNKVNIGDDCNVSCINEILIGDGVRLGRKVMINDNSHGTFTKTDLNKSPIERELVSKGAIIIEKNVWVGEMAVILAGVHIGEGTIIATNAVVTKDIPAFCIAAGVPAKVVKKI